MNKSLNILGKPDENKAWVAEFVTIADYVDRLKTEIDVSCERVYRRKKRK